MRGKCPFCAWIMEHEKTCKKRKREMRLPDDIARLKGELAICRASLKGLAFEILLYHSHFKRHAIATLSAWSQIDEAPVYEVPGCGNVYLFPAAFSQAGYSIVKNLSMAEDVL